MFHLPWIHGIQGFVVDCGFCSNLLGFQVCFRSTLLYLFCLGYAVLASNLNNRVSLSKTKQKTGLEFEKLNAIPALAFGISVPYRAFPDYMKLLDSKNTGIEKT